MKTTLFLLLSLCLSAVAALAQDYAVNTERPDPPLFAPDSLNATATTGAVLHNTLSKVAGTSFDGRVAVVRRPVRCIGVGELGPKDECEGPGLEEQTGKNVNKFAFDLQTPELLVNGPLSENLDPEPTQRAPHVEPCFPEGDYYRCGPGGEVVVDYTAFTANPIILADPDRGSPHFSSTGICDPPRAPLAAGHEQSVPTRQSSPYACDADFNPDPTQNVFDCYDLTPVVILDVDEDGDDIMDYAEIWGRPVTVRVANPKSRDRSQAGRSRVDGLIFRGDPVMSPTVHDIVRHIVPGFGMDLDLVGQMTLSGDGRLMVIDGGIRSGLLYSVIPESEAACDVSVWGDPLIAPFKPITEMYTDPAMELKYGLGRYPLRDTENQLLTAPVLGRFPWIDRDGDNLIFSHVLDNLYYQEAVEGVPTGTIASQYPVHEDLPMPGVNEPGNPTSPDPPASPAEILTISEKFATSMGLVVTGLWTHGKLFMPDNRLNSALVNVNRAMQHFRYLTLYCLEDGEDCLDGQGQQPDGDDVEVGGTGTYGNNSIENQSNHLPHASPDSDREVVWIASNTRTDEVVFDDVNLNESFIVSNMNPSIDSSTSRFYDGFRWNSTPGGFSHYDTGEGFRDVPRIANFATSVPVTAWRAVPNGQRRFGGPHVLWNVPAHGELHGGARIEPVAAGGIKGRGLWLDGVDDYLDYVVPGQWTYRDQWFARRPWFFTLSINPRDTRRMRLLQTPDGSYMDIHGRRKLKFGKVSGPVHVIDLRNLEAATGPSDLQFGDDRWSTIGILSNPAAVEDEEAVLRIFFDGMLIKSYTAGELVEDPQSVDDYAFFRFVSWGYTVGTGIGPDLGRVTLGAPEGSQQLSYRGWLDDFKVFSEIPNLEVVCNHARGTIVRIEPGEDSGDYPAATHKEIEVAAGEPVDTRFFCERPRQNHVLPSDYLCLGSNRRPELQVSPERCMRGPLLVGPGVALIYDQPRPDFTQNAFCLSCHASSHPEPTLQVIALEPSEPGDTTSTDMRRQPLQNSPRIFGQIPADYFGGGFPDSPLTTDEVGMLLDWLLAGEIP